MVETAPPTYFGEWLKQRRNALDLTQAELAGRVGCSVHALRKIEAGERRPSKQLAELIAKSLEVSPEDQAIFVRVARGELNIERLRPPLHAISDEPALKPSLPPGNLPGMLTTFIGREPELAALSHLMHDPQCRLLSLIGAGGIGKTRLAIEAGIRHIELFPDGVWFVPLAPLSSSEYLIPAIADAMNFRFLDPAKPKGQLLKHLQGKNALLVLDNAEHLLDGAGLFTEIVETSPQVKVLVTSREKLNLLGEWVFELQGLPVPPSDRVEHIEEYSSTALFIQSARHLQAGFKVRGDERQWIVRICQIMEGMPLGIELAAAWVGLLSCEEIAREIESDLDFLTVSMRDLPQRHRSLRASLDHSWNMLNPEERLILGRLSVFRGSFNREAAEEICGASLATLSSLRDKSILRRLEGGRFDLHELIRQYSAAHLADDPQECAAVQLGHYGFYLALVEVAGRELKGPNQLKWLGWLEQEHDNLRAALEWAQKRDGEATDGRELALQLSGALRWFWWMHGHFHEGRNWLMKALQLSPQMRTAARASALLGLSMLESALGDLGVACPPAEESAAIYRELGDPVGLAEALTIAGRMSVWQGKANLGCASLEEALAIYRKAGDRWGEAQALFRLGWSLVDYSGDPAGRAMLEESAAIMEDLGDKYLFDSFLITLGIVDMGFGDYAAARAHFMQGMTVAREIGHPWGVADALTNLGCVYRIQGEYASAESQLKEAQQVYREVGGSIWETDVLCALAENAIVQGSLSTARYHLQAASSLLETSENKWLQTLVRYFQGLLAYYEGDTAAAMEFLSEATRLAREGQYKPDLARSLVALARVKRTLGEVTSASESLLEGLDLYQVLGHRLGVAIALEELAAFGVAQGDGARAVILISVADALRKQLGAPLPPVDFTAYNSLLAASRAQLGETAFTAAWARAAARPFQEVVEEIRG